MTDLCFNILEFTTVDRKRVLFHIAHLHEINGKINTAIQYYQDIIKTNNNNNNNNTTNHPSSSSSSFSNQSQSHNNSQDQDPFTVSSLASIKADAYRQIGEITL